MATLAQALGGVRLLFLLCHWILMAVQRHLQWVSVGLECHLVTSRGSALRTWFLARLILSGSAGCRRLMLLEVKSLLYQKLFSIFGLMANIQRALRPGAILWSLSSILSTDYERIHCLLLLRLLHCVTLIQIIEHLLVSLLLALVGFGTSYCLLLLLPDSLLLWSHNHITRILRGKSTCFCERARSRLTRIDFKGAIVQDKLLV